MFEKYKGFKSFLLVLIIYCTGMYLVPLRMMHYDLSFIPGGLGDSRLTNYLLEHGYKWLSGQTTNFWDAPFFYPVSRVMTFADNHLGTLPIYSFFRLLSFDRETSYQLWFLSLFTLNYFCCTWVLKKFSVSFLGAAAGAFIFTFSLPIVAQINAGHSQLLPIFMIPFAFYFTWEYLEKREVKMFALACFAVVIQFYCSMYIGFLLILGLFALFVAFIIMHNSRWSLLREIFWGSFHALALKAIIVVLAIVSLLPLVIPYYQTALEYGMRSWQEIEQMLPRVSSYFYPIAGSFLWHWLGPVGSTLPMRWEHHLFVGFLPLLAFAMMPIFFYYKNKEIIFVKGMVAFITIVILILFTLYIYADCSLYKFSLFIPGLKSVRAVTRIVFIMLFPLALILGIFINRIAENNRLKLFPIMKIITLVFLLSFLIFDQGVKSTGLGAYSKLDSQNRLKQLEGLVKKNENPVKVFAYMPDKLGDPCFVHVDAMLVAQNLNLATVNGYSALFPQYHFDFFKDYDQCNNLHKIIKVHTNEDSKYYKGREIFQDLHVVGREDCSGDHGKYTFMNKALPEIGYNAKITFSSSRLIVSANMIFELTVHVKNNGPVIWRCLSGDNKGRYAIRLSYRWLSSDNSPMGGFGDRMSLPRDVHPGESASFNYAIQAPTAAGTYFLEFDLVQEHVAWFCDKGNAPLIIEVKVVPRVC